MTNRLFALTVALVTLLLAGIVTGCGSDETTDLAADVAPDTADTLADGDGDGDGDGETDAPLDAVADSTTDGENAPDGSTDDAVADPGIDTIDVPDESEGLQIIGVVVTINPRNELSYFVEWQTNEPATTRLSFECGAADPGATLASDDLTTDHRVFMMGLVENTTCTLELASTTADGRTATAGEELTTVDLADESFPPATVTIYEPNRVQPGWNLITLLNQFDGENLRVALVDALGRYRWYHRSTFNVPGADNDLRTVPDGVLIGGTPPIRPQIVRWDGSLVWEGDRAMHHHIMLWPDDEHVFYIRAPGDSTCDEQNTGYAVPTIQTIETKEIVWEWALCHHYDPPADVDDWEHANTLEPFPDENAFLHSPRNQNALIRVNRDTEEIDWIMGFGGRAIDGFAGDFEMAEDDRFYRQHAPEIQDDGNILLYDNGLVGFRAESRAIEIAYDLEEMTAEVVWEYRHDPPLFSNIWGDADSLPNGNRLITFGFRNRTQGTVLVEARADADSTPVWVLEFPPKWGTYRTERVVDPPRGYVIAVEE